jgi:DHA1 family multidrug resistance protein-like MFS transporter
MRARGPPPFSCANSQKKSMSSLTRFTARWAPFRLFAFPRSVRYAVGIEVRATLLFTAFNSLTGPFTGLILRRDLSATPFQLSLAASAGAAWMLLSLAWARLMARRSPLSYFIWPTFFARALFLLIPFVFGPWPFLAILVGAGLLGSVAGPAQAALIRAVYPREHRGQALGAIRMWGALAGIVITVTGGTLLAHFGYRAVFPVAALLGMIGALYLRRLPVPPPSQQPEATDLGASGPSNPEEAGRFRGLLIGSFIFGMGIWIQAPANPLMLVDILHATTRQVGLFAAVATLTSLIGNGYWGWRVSHRPIPSLLRVVYLLGAVVPLIYALAWTPWLLLGVSVIEGVMLTGLDLVWMMAIIDAGGPERTMHYAALSMTLTGLRGIIGPLLGGLIITYAGVRAVYVVAVVLMLASALMLGLPRRAVRPRPAATSRLPAYGHQPD